MCKVDGREGHKTRLEVTKEHRQNKNVVSKLTRTPF